MTAAQQEAGGISVSFQLQFRNRAGSKVKAEHMEEIGMLLYALANGAVDVDGIPNVSKEQIVEYAKNHPEHPIAKYFEWDEEKAAEKYLLIQAGQIIRSIGIVCLRGGQVVEAPAMISAFIQSPGGMRRAYVPTEDVFNNPELSRQVVQEAKRHLGDWLLRFRAFEGLARITQQIQVAIQDTEDIRAELPPDPPRRPRRR